MEYWEKEYLEKLDREKTGGYRANQYQRYYSDKTSFLKTLLKTCARLIRFTLICIIFGVLFSLNNMDYVLLTGLSWLWLLGSAGIAIHFVYFIIRCIVEDNLRL